MIDNKNIEQAKREIKKSQDKPLIVKAQDDNFNRKILEYGNFDILLSPEAGNRKQTNRQIDSGLNHVLAKIATKNKIAIGIDLENIKKTPKKDKAYRLARIKQNISICRKTKTRLIIKDGKNKKEAFHLLLSLGASTQQTKEATQTF